MLRSNAFAIKFQLEPRKSTNFCFNYVKVDSSATAKSKFCKICSSTPYLTHFSISYCSPRLCSTTKLYVPNHFSFDQPLYFPKSPSYPPKKYPVRLTKIHCSPSFSKMHIYCISLNKQVICQQGSFFFFMFFTSCVNY